MRINKSSEHNDKSYMYFLSGFVEKLMGIKDSSASDGPSERNAVAYALGVAKAEDSRTQNTTVDMMLSKSEVEKAVNNLLNGNGAGTLCPDED